MSFRTQIAIAATVGVLVLATLVTWLAGPAVGAWAVRTRVLPALATRLDRTVTADSIEVGLGEVVLEGLTVAGPRDPAGAPLVRAPRVRIEYGVWGALVGSPRLGVVRVERPHVTVARAADGTDNVRDLVDRLRRRRDGGATGGGGRRPKELVVTDGTFVVEDQVLGVRAAASTWSLRAARGGGARAEVRGLTGTVRPGARFAVGSLTAEADVADPERTLAVTIAEGSVAVLPKLALTGVAGTVAAGAEGRATIQLAGGYGGVVGTLWKAEGWLDPRRGDADLHLRADRFTLDRLEQILAGTPIQTPARTAIDAALDLTVRGGDVVFAGSLGVEGLTLYHPGLAAEPVRDQAFTGQIRGEYARKARTLRLDELTVTVRGVEVRLDGLAAFRGGLDEDGRPRTEPRLRAHLVVPPVPCQAALAAFPPEVVPHLQGFKLDGRFASDVTVAIDWADLEATQLDGSVGIKGCRVVAAPPEASAERLLGEFEHTVALEQDVYTTFRVGPSNPDFVPLYEVSPYLTNSFMSTEDASFLRHRGFIVREFRSALVRNLQEGYFKYGASSITMQLVKNIFLYRDKTLARKLQELFLAWHIEKILGKARLMEIYVNVIEFGPGIYGIGPAARHYFGKRARDINPVEAAFFSSILPNPKKRYLQYCEGELSRRGDAKVQRILKLALDRQLLTEAEYARALETPLVFDRAEALPEAECKARTRRMIEAARRRRPAARRAP